MLIKKIEKPEKTIISVLGIKIAHKHKKIFKPYKDEVIKYLKGEV